MWFYSGVFIFHVKGFPGWKYNEFYTNIETNFTWSR